MKIVMFTNTYTPHVGGVAKSVTALTEDLRELGHSVMVVAPTFPDTEVDFNATDNIIRVPAWQNFNGSDFSVRLPIPFALTAALDEFAPDLVHSHHPFLLGDTAIRMARRYMVPLVFTHHTRYERYTHYVPVDSERMRAFASQLATEYANLCSGVIAPSESMRTLLQERGVSSAITVVPTGVDTTSFARNDPQYWRRKLGLAPDTPLIGHVGRLAEEKNLDYLGRAIASVLKRSPECHAAIAGDGPSRKTLQQYFAANNLDDRVSFCGMLQGQELVDFYAGLDRFLFASTSETQGMVLAEAMAAGTPVVALDAPGAREVVNSDNGRLLETDCGVIDFADAVLAELEDRAHNDAKRRAAKTTAESFSRRVCAETMLGFYRQRIERFQHERNDSLPEVLEPVVGAIKTEWELIGEKTAALIGSLQN